MLGYEGQDPAYITPVVVSQPEYNTVVLKKLLINSFSATDFEIFCFDYFRPVYDEFTPDMGQGLRVFLLISYCDKHHLYRVFHKILYKLSFNISEVAGKRQTVDA